MLVFGREVGFLGLLAVPEEVGEFGDCVAGWGLVWDVGCFLLHVLGEKLHRR